MRTLWLAGLTLSLFGASAWASPVEVVLAEFARESGGWRVSVTLRHGDTGWEHYADLWVVESLEGEVLGRRVLAHPHENEQPFTRSRTIAIPPGVTRVRVRAGDNVEGLNSNVVLVDLGQSRGERFRVISR
ncbi:MAG: hypothetical protein O7A67_03355 [SAR324 cluster bacterium]|nr:hypothetical protein [SAR324 cluster bacterium]